MQAIFVVRRRTATTPLPCEVRKMHGKDQAKRTAKQPTRQWNHKAHGKDFMHGRDSRKRMAKYIARQRRCRLPTFAVRVVRMHGNVTFAVHFTFAVRLVEFSSFFFSILFILKLILIL